MNSATLQSTDSKRLDDFFANALTLTPTLGDAIAMYVRAVESAGNLRPNTIRHYRHDLELFLRHTRRHSGPSVTVRDITTGDVHAFLEALRVRGNAPTSCRRRLAALRRFFTTMVEWGYLIDDPTARLHAQATTPQRPVTLSLHECLQLLEAAKTTRHPRRDHAMFRLFLTSGCTLSELIGLRRSDVNLEVGSIRFCGRGNVKRTLNLSHGTKAALGTYLEQRSKAPADRHALFLNRHGDPVTKGAVYHAFLLTRERAGIVKEGLSVHSLRHTCIALLWRAGVSLHILQRIAGHQSLASTREYEWAGVRPSTPRPWEWIHPIDESIERTVTPLG